MCPYHIFIFVWKLPRGKHLMSNLFFCRTEYIYSVCVCVFKHADIYVCVPILHIHVISKYELNAHICILCDFRKEDRIEKDKSLPTHYISHQCCDTHTCIQITHAHTHTHSLSLSHTHIHTCTHAHTCLCSQPRILLLWTADNVEGKLRFWSFIIFANM